MGGSLDSSAYCPTPSVEQGVVPVGLRHSDSARGSGVAYAGSNFGSSPPAEDLAPHSKEPRSMSRPPQEISATSPSARLQTCLSPEAAIDHNFSNISLQGSSMLSPKAHQGRALFLSAVDGDTTSESPEFDAEQVLQP